MRSLVLLAFFGFTGFFVTLAALPSWAVQGGASEGAAGVVTAVLLAATVAVQSAVPALQRRLGVTRLLRLGLLALAIPAPFYLVGHQLWWLAVLSAVRGAGFAVLTVLGALLAARVAPPERRGESVGIYGLGIALPNLAAVPAGTALTASGHFAVVAIVAAAPLLAVLVLRPFAALPAERADAPARGDTGRTVRAAAPPAVMLFVVTLAGGGLVTFLPIARPGDAVPAVALLAYGVTGAVGRWRVGRLLPRHNVVVLLVGLGTTALGLLAVAVTLRGDGAAAIAVLIAGAAVLGFGYGATQNATQVVAFERAGADHLVTASAVWNAAFDAGTAVGAYAVGAVAAAGLGLPSTYALCAGIVLAATTLVVTGRARR